MGLVTAIKGDQTPHCDACDIAKAAPMEATTADAWLMGYVQGRVSAELEERDAQLDAGAAFGFTLCCCKRHAELAKSIMAAVIQRNGGEFDVVNLQKPAGPLS